MNHSLLKLSTLFFLTFTVLFSCKKKDEDVVPPILTRQLQLEYNNDSDDTKKSFATLKEDKEQFVFNWSQAMSEASIIHIAYCKIFGDPYLTSPKNGEASYTGPNGISNWGAKTEIIFDNVLSDVKFSSLTYDEVENSVPDAGFGLNNASTLLAQPGKTLRFIQKDANGKLIYKGYIKIETVDNINNPSKINMEVKYIKK